MTTPVKHANSELVAVAWVKSVPGIAPGQVATTLPAAEEWPAGGFLQITPGIGGSPQVEYALREPVVQVEAYAVNPSSGKPPWGTAASLLEMVAAATWAPDHGMRPALTLRPGFPQARVQSVHLLTEPRRMPDDDSSYARYVTDLALHWIEL